MRLKFWTTLALLIALPSGCAKVSSGDFCDIAEPIYFSSINTIDMLMLQDRALVVDIVSHNETVEKQCGESHD